MCLGKPFPSQSQLILADSRLPCGLILPNRICKTATSEHLAHPITGCLDWIGFWIKKKRPTGSHPVELSLKHQQLVISPCCLGEPLEEIVTLYREWARGGSGLIITGNVMVDHHLEGPGNLANLVSVTDCRLIPREPSSTHGHPILCRHRHPAHTCWMAR